MLPIHLATQPWIRKGTPYFVINHSDSSKKYIEDDIRRKIYFLTDNIFVSNVWRDVSVSSDCQAYFLNKDCLLGDQLFTVKHG